MTEAEKNCYIQGEGRRGEILALVSAFQFYAARMNIGALFRDREARLLFVRWPTGWHVAFDLVFCVCVGVGVYVRRMLILRVDTGAIDHHFFLVFFFFFFFTFEWRGCLSEKSFYVNDMKKKPSSIYKFKMIVSRENSILLHI